MAKCTATRPWTPAYAATLLESSLTGAANVLICPNLDAANILFNVLKTTGGHGTTIGPILMGCSASAHVLTPPPPCAAWST
jgi:phosphotransacetylase